MPKKLTDIDSAKVKEAVANSNSLSHGLAEDEIGALAGTVEIEEFEPNEFIVKEDDDSRDMLIILSGVASIELKLSPDDDSAVQLSKIRKGGVIGEFSFIDGSKRSANIKALEKCVVLRMQYEALNELCEKNHTLGYKIMRNLAGLMSQRLRSTNFELRSHLYL